MQLACLTVIEFRSQAHQHANIVTGLELFCQDQGLALYLVKDILQLGDPVCRIDVHQYRADFCRCELADNPLQVVWRPNSNPVSILYPMGEQIGSHAVNQIVQF